MASSYMSLVSLRAASVSSKLAMLAYKEKKKVPTVTASTYKYPNCIYKCLNRKVKSFGRVFKIYSHFCDDFDLKFLIWCSNFSGMVLDVLAGTVRKHMLSMCKNRTRSLMRVQPMHEEVNQKKPIDEQLTKNFSLLVGIGRLHIVYPSKFVAIRFKNTSKNYEALCCNL